MDRIAFEKQYWDNAADQNEVIFDSWLTEETYKVVRNFVEWGSPWAVFELGCGNGRLLNRLATEFSGKHFLGIDVSPIMLRKASAIKPDNANYSLCDGKSLGIQFSPDSRKFNAAFCVTVFQHLESDVIEQYINEVSQALDPLGHFLFQFIEGNESEPLSKHYTFEQMTQWLTNAELTIKKHYRAVHESWTWIEATK